MRATRPRLCVLLALMLPGVHSAADFLTGMEAYLKKDFDTALKEFRDGAEMGDEQAQFNLGVMLMRGEGATSEPIEAYGWIALSAASQDAGREKARLQVWKQLPEDAQQPARARFESFNANYGQAALLKTLYPETSADDRELTLVKPTRRVQAKYPRKAYERGAQAIVDTEYTINERGLAEDVRVVNVVASAAPTEFADSVVRMFRAWTFEPPRIDGKPVRVFGAKLRATFAIPQDTLRGRTAKKYDVLDTSRVNKTMDDLRAQADQGDPLAQYRLAYVLSMVDSSPETHAEQHKHDNLHEINALYLRSARSGIPAAQYEIGRNLVYGSGCHADEAKGLIWIHRAAAKGHDRAEAFLGEHFLREGEVAKAVEWFSKAAREDVYTQRRLAWIYATTADESLRNPAEALILATKATEMLDDLQSRETLAAALAVNGRFDDALAFQRKAIEEAEDWDIPTNNMALRAAAYEQRKAWVEARCRRTRSAALVI